MQFIKSLFHRRPYVGLWVYDPARLSEDRRKTLPPHMLTEVLWVMELQADGTGVYLGKHQCQHSVEGDRITVRMAKSEATEGLADNDAGRIDDSQVVLTYRFVEKGMVVQLDSYYKDMHVPLRLES